MVIIQASELVVFDHHLFKKVTAIHQNEVPVNRKVIYFDKTMVVKPILVTQVENTSYDRNNVVRFIENVDPKDGSEILYRIRITKVNNQSVGTWKDFKKVEDNFTFKVITIVNV